MRKILLALLISSQTMIFAANSNFTDKFEKRSVYGKWIDVDKGKIIEINSKTKFSFERLDNDLIILKNGAKKSYLKRIGVQKTKISGRVVEDRGGKNLYAISNSRVTIENRNDSSVSVVALTNNRGFFSDETLPSGEYYVKVRKGRNSIKVPVALTNGRENLGSFVIKSKRGANFKSELIMGNTFVLSNSKRYKAKIRIRNYGQVQGRVCYSASIKDRHLKSLGFTKNCKTIKANRFIDLPIYLSFKPIKINSETKKLTINLKDARGRTLTESHAFEVYRNYFNLRIKTPLKNIKGYVILPGQKLKEINVKKGRLLLPRLSDKEYKLILANGDAKAKTSYTVDIGAEQKLERGIVTTKTKKKRRGRSRGRSKSRKTSLFKLRQSIGRYPNIGDIAIYSFVIPDVIRMREDDKSIRVRFTQKDSMGDVIKYRPYIRNSKLAKISYKGGYLTVTPYKNANGITTIELRNKKGYGKNKKKLFTLVVRSINDKPIITTKPITKIKEGQKYKYYFKGKDLETKYLKKILVKGPKWLKFSPRKGLLSGIPKKWDEGKHLVVLKRFDGKDSVTQSFTVNVRVLARAPKSFKSSFEIDEDETLNAALKRKNKAVYFSLNKKAKHGKVTLSKTGKFTYVPKANFFGNDLFTVKATSNKKSSISTVAITVKSINDIPTAKDIVVGGIGASQIKVNWEKESQAKDIDEDELNVKVITAPTMGTLEINDENLLVYTPNSETKGTDKAVLEISDINGGKIVVNLRLEDVLKQLTPRVLQTGQKVIYHGFDDAIYTKSLPRVYKKNMDKLIVKDMTLENSWYIPKENRRKTFTQAKEYCEELIVSRVDGWRLPTIEELVLLTNKGRTASAVSNEISNVQNDYYWSSTDYAKRASYKWVLYFHDGADFYRHVSGEHYTMCVKSGLDLTPTYTVEGDKIIDLNATQPIVATIDSNTTKDMNKTVVVKPKPKPRFASNKVNQTVVDHKSELLWYDAKSLDKATWVVAIKTCEQLKYDGFENWRLPNFNELYTIADHSGIRPALQKEFANRDSDAYWTSTSSDDVHDRAWGISFANGGDFMYDKAEQINVRCVRDK